VVAKCSSNGCCNVINLPLRRTAMAAPLRFERSCLKAWTFGARETRIRSMPLVCVPFCDTATAALELTRRDLAGTGASSVLQMSHLSASGVHQALPGLNAASVALADCTKDKHRVWQSTSNQKQRCLEKERLTPPYRNGLLGNIVGAALLRPRKSTPTRILTVARNSAENKSQVLEIFRMGLSSPAILLHASSVPSSRPLEGLTPCTLALSNKKNFNVHSDCRSRIWC
jgi:hypothetical protein